MTIQEGLAIIMEGKDLTEKQAELVMLSVMSGDVHDVQLAALLTALRIKGETVEEVTGFAKAMRAKGVTLRTDIPVMDVVGTGGDGSNTFNISTITCFILGALGIPIAKHGNRSVSSKCGAADMLEALGAQVSLTTEEAERLLREVGMCFFFAPTYHPAMKYAGPVRKALGMRTVFNILGPLTNPIGAKREVMGVYSKDLVEPMARVLSNLGVTRGAVIHGDDGLDEITLTTTTTICKISGPDQFETYVLDPRHYGFSYCKLEDLQGSDGVQNKEIAEQILQGEKGPKRDIVVLNAAFALHVYDPVHTMEEAIQLVEGALDDGRAYRFMKDFAAATQASKE